MGERRLSECLSGAAVVLHPVWQRDGGCGGDRRLRSFRILDGIYSTSADDVPSLHFLHCALLVLLVVNSLSQFSAEEIEISTYTVAIPLLQPGWVTQDLGYSTIL